MTSDDNKRIAKNTMFLYVRTFVTMVIGLYTSRKILEILGVDDFGILNVVGGIIAMVAFLNSSMSVATQRFLTIELGREDRQAFRMVFSMCVVIHVAIAILALLLGETIGLWFVNTYLNIPSGRMTAANVVYQTSVLSAVIGIMQTPYNAAIVSHERMHVCAYVGLGESVAKLIIVFMLLLSSFDRLIIYAILFLCVQITSCIIYRVYCLRNFSDCRVKFTTDKTLLKNIVNFTGWNMFGTVAWIVKDNGASILLNLFGGTAINAARGIASTLSNASNTLVSGFQSAVNPQLTKNYAADDREATCRLLCRSSRVSYILVLILMLPLFLECPFVLDLWLVDVPENTVLFTRIVLIEALVANLQGPLITALMATGNIKWYQIVVGGILLLNIPVAYLLLKAGGHIAIPLIVSLIFVIVGNILRVIFCHSMIGLSYKEYVRTVIAPICLVTVTSSILPIVLYHYIEDGLMQMIVVTLASIACVGISSWLIAFSVSERQFLMAAIKSKLRSKSIKFVKE